MYRKESRSAKASGLDRGSAEVELRLAELSVKLVAGETSQSCGSYPLLTALFCHLPPGLGTRKVVPSYSTTCHNTTESIDSYLCI